MTAARLQTGQDDPVGQQSQAGSVAMVTTGRLDGLRQRQAGHDPGPVLVDVAVAIADALGQRQVRPL